MGVGPPYLPLPPPVHPGLPRRARSVHGTWVERWGRGRGTSGHRRAPFYPPSPGAAPKKKWHLGKGGRGGGNHPQHQTRPSPYPPPSLARTGPKVRGLDGSGKGVGRGGTSQHHDLSSATSRTGTHWLRIFFCFYSEMLSIFLQEFFRPFYLAVLCKTGRNAVHFFAGIFFVLST